MSTMPEATPPDGWWNDPDNDAVHGWFGLSYASYLVINRTLLQSMPGEWQRRFVGCLDELRAHYDGVLPTEPNYFVHVKADNGRFVQDPVPHYNRGRTYVAGSTS